MNKNIAKPLIIQFTPPEENPQLKRSQTAVFVPVNAIWVQFKDNVLPLVADTTYDSVLVNARSDVDRDIKGVVGNMSIKINALAGAGTRAGKPVLSYEKADKPFYLANPTKNDMKEAHIYAPADDIIMEKYNSYESDAAWQEYQSKIWNRMKDMMPLSKKSDQYNRNHAGQLKNPKRGLEDKDLDKFWSFKSRQGLSPTVMGDDMIGMPSIEGREYEGFTMSVNQPDGTVQTKPLEVRSLMTIGASGIAIPMANADGYVNKHQIATDLTAYGTVLHFRAADGVTVAKKELFDKKTREYSFKFADGTDTHLKVTDVNDKETITMQDVKGTFYIQPKKEIMDVLKERGYNVPEIIASVKAEQNGKYMWQSPGTMTGSDDVLKTVSPSNPGFIKAREPKNGEEQYIVLVAEGALKGHIVAKYVDVKDKEGVCFGDKIAGDKGIIVTQVPGVAEAYVKNALTIYEKYNVAGTYIAMDADGRENRNVAKGIHSAYEYISKANPTTVLSWNPEQKGMDDALLAVAQGKITIREMGIVSGTPETLFPIEKAHEMLPYKLDGTRTATPSWVQEYDEDKKIREEKMAAAQAETAVRQEQKITEQETKTQYWVKTPQDISNIQNATIAKSADMADAMAGVIPSSKSDSKVVITPDVDEKITPEKDDTKEESSIKDSIKNAIREWNSINQEMPSIPVPGGYKSTYNYKQPVQPVPGMPITLSNDFQYEEGYTTKQGHKWGIINIETEHELSVDEKQNRQKELNEGSGVVCIGNMKLISQSFTLNQEKSLELSDDDIVIKNPDELEIK